MTVGKIPNAPVSLFCVIYDGLTAALNHLKQSNRSAFPWPCPAFCSSDPNPFHLRALSNFTQSSRSLSWKGGIWPARPENRSLFLSPGRRSTAPRPPFARNYEGYFRCSNLKNTWDTQNTHSEERNTLGRSAENMVKRGLDAHQGTRPFIHTPPLGSAPPHPPARAEAWEHTRTEAHLETPGLHPDVRADLEAWHLSAAPCFSHLLSVARAAWPHMGDLKRFHLCEVLTVAIAFQEIHHLTFKDQSCLDSFSKFATFRFLLMIRLSEPHQRIFFYQLKMINDLIKNEFTLVMALNIGILKNK